MNAASGILHAIRRAGVEVRRVDGKLQILGKLPPDLASKLREHRAAIVDALEKPAPVFAPTVLWATPGHAHVVKALADQDAERMAAWACRKAGRRAGEENSGRDLPT